jgi:tRNA(Ile)-lysidine synthase
VEALPTILYEILKDYSFSPGQVPEVINLLDSETGKYVSSSTHRVIRNRQWLIIAPQQNHLSATVVIDKGMRELLFDLGSLALETGSKTSLASQSWVAQLDASTVQFPILLRKWKEGDYFYPLGMKKKKKLSRFFIDQKLSKTEKEKVWVLEMNKKIIWVIGHRIDDRFKIKPDTTEQLRIELKKAMHV